jgi:hypothetical protein
MTVGAIGVAISFLAFIIAGYGVVERRNAANRADRVRLTEITADLAELRLKRAELPGLRVGEIEALNSRIALLAQQATSLIRSHEISLTSAECREVATCLDLSGYPIESEEMWELTRENARAEGNRHTIYADRGFAYFLFRDGRVREARELLNEVASKFQPSTDGDRLTQASTLLTWRTLEIDGPEDDPDIQEDLRRRIEKVAATCVTLGAKRQIATRLDAQETARKSE